MHINPYLNFGGRCAEAFAFYKQQLAAQNVTVMPYRGSPEEERTPANWRDKIMHAALPLGDTVLMGSDGMPNQPYEGIKGCAITLNVADDAEAERVFKALAQDGAVTMPLARTFWASKFGMLTDKFGLNWMVMCEEHPS